jgi:hypothetical protein
MPKENILLKQLTLSLKPNMLHMVLTSFIFLLFSSKSQQQVNKIYNFFTIKKLNVKFLSKLMLSTFILRTKSPEGNQSFPKKEKNNSSSLIYIWGPIL